MLLRRQGCHTRRCTLNACMQGATECRASHRRPVPQVIKASCRVQRLTMEAPDRARLLLNSSTTTAVLRVRKQPITPSVEVRRGVNFPSVITWWTVFWQRDETEEHLIADMRCANRCDIAIRHLIAAIGIGYRSSRRIQFLGWWLELLSKAGRDRCDFCYCTTSNAIGQRFRGRLRSGSK